ncbi:MAG: signal peptidase II [bacterium]|jgi:signal peptidase II|nr:lipoprotein signal peptidase [Gammaproteobacteria bacterium]HIG35685.1 lipoprotein signal peptidase [Gammaproteobacteria bacterium]|tara:strand:+ start:265 stop:774 length:510 start_codon:yes stop_codon:yes gene_type:complete
MLKSRSYSYWIWLLVVFAIIFVDQYSKFLVVERLNLFDRLTLTAFLDFTRLHNTGAAFSIFASDSGWQRWPLTLISAGVGTTLIGWLVRNAAKSPVLLNTAFAMIAGGAIGNLIDRLNQGYVVDFILFHIGQWHYPTFNVADSCITIGLILFLIETYRSSKRAKKTTRH